MMLSQEETRRLFERVLGFSKADETEVSLTGQQRGHTRFAVNSASTSGFTDTLTLGITVRFGKRVGSSTTDTFTDDSLKRTVAAAEAIAGLSPESPEAMPALGPQQYTPVPAAYDEATAKAGPEWRAGVVAATTGPASDKGLVAAGFVSTQTTFQAIANSKGLFGYHTSTGADFTTTVRTKDGTGSGWAAADANAVGGVDGPGIAARAIRKAELSVNPVAIEPGKYTVILEPTAAADLVRFMMFMMNARTADEGRSFLSKPGGGTRVGEKFFDERVSIYTDPASAVGPGAPFSSESLPSRRMDIVKNGVVMAALRNRYWAEQTKQEPVPFPTNIIIAGGKTSVDEMIASTERGVLVTRFWYIRLVDQRTVLLTGLTRDGTFLVERGKIKHAIKNFRFNESPIIMLNNIEAMSPEVRVQTSEGNPAPILAPALKVANFTFTSLSDAV